MNILDKTLKVEPTGIKAKSGKIIISAPFMHDFFFGRSIVILLEYNDEGSMGLIINKPTELFVSDMIDGFPRVSIPLYIGGPVQTDSIFFIHNRPDLIDDSMKIYDNLHWGGNFKQLRTFIAEGLIQPNEIRFFLGYSGWEAHQLDNELKTGTWIVANKLSFKSIMNTDANILWHNTIKSLGNKYLHWLNFPENPEDN